METEDPAPKTHHSATRSQLLCANCASGVERMENVRGWMWLTIESSDHV